MKMRQMQLWWYFPKPQSLTVRHVCWIGKVGCGHQEWASDWKDLNGLIKPLIQQHEAAEAEMASRQAAAQEGMDLFQRFAQLKDLQIKELQPGPSGVVQLEKIIEKQHFKNGGCCGPAKNIWWKEVK